MLPIAEHYDALAVAQQNVLRRTLTGISDEELDWRPHPEANPIRWILGHMLWFERWVPDVIQETGRYLEDTDPLSFPPETVEHALRDLDAASRHRRQVYEGIAEADLEREFDYLGRFRYTVSRLLRTHAAHQTGHGWQIRYIRGTYSRAHGTDKSVFDPF